MTSVIDELRDIKDKCDLREFVANDLGAPLYRMHHSYVQFPCPFHVDSNPSFTVYEAHFKCYGCDIHGDLMDYIQARYGFESLSAVLGYLRGGATAAPVIPLRAAEPPPQPTVGAERLRRTLAMIVEEAVFRFRDSRAQKYCRERGWHEVTQRAYSLGYLSMGCDDASAFQDGEAVEELGLIDKNGFVWIGGRLIIPIYDHGGRLAALATRNLPPRDAEMRYINTRRTPIFHRDKVLYGASVLPRPAHGALFVVEGYADAWSAHTHGLNAVAIMGDRMTKWQAEVIGMRALADNLRVVLAFDGDMGGQGGYNPKTERWEMGGEQLAASALQKLGIPAVRLRLPSGDVSDALRGADEGAADTLRNMLSLLEVMQECPEPTDDTAPLTC